MEVLLQAWFFLSPVIYSMNQVFKEGAQLVYWLNPMASFIESYRTILFFDYSPDFLFTVRTCFYGLAMFVVGYAFFMWKRKRIGELL
jgi:ABC-type polysaccharide/polyol phosphate export permease